MQTLVLRHAAADAGVAGELTHFLEMNCSFPVIQKPLIFDAGEELVETVERALSADFVIALLSPESVPSGLLEMWPPCADGHANAAGFGKSGVRHSARCALEPKPNRDRWV